MNGVIEALHIFDDNRNPILSHTYTGRPLSAAHLLPLYLEHPAPRPNLIYLPNTNPPTLIFSLTHANLLFLITTSTEIEPLLVFEFLHRVIDAFEDFVGAPILAVKIENNYDVVAQLLTEMCDAGTISTTEPNALREVVEQEGWVDKFLGGLSLPGKSPLTTNFSNSSAPSLMSSNTPALPWRRANVKHTSNEMYADIVETLSVTLAPSGRPLAAFANGTIAFTSKVSGIPDVMLTLTSPSGKHNLNGIMELPVFHPCVRLNRWKERPGELSFIPPDGRFILAGYEVDLLPFTSGKSGSMNANNLKLPVNMEVKTGLGSTGSDFEVRLQVNKVPGAPSPASSGLGRGGSGRLGGPHPGSPASPLVDDLNITIPLPTDVRNLSEIRPSRGDASFNPGDRVLEWNIPAKELSGGTSYFGLRCTVVGPLVDDDEEELDPTGFGFGTDYSFNEPYQSVPVAKSAKQKESTGDDRDVKKIAQNKILMPTSASVSFSVKGWLASGLKVESMMIDPRKSRGLGETMKPFKGVKYLTVSKGGVEIRSVCVTCSSGGPCLYLLYLVLAPSPPQSRRWSTHRGGTRTALFFPGQGVQRVGMLTPWLEAFPATASQLRDEIDHHMGYKLTDIIQNGPSRILNETPNAQPAIMATSIFILRILEREFDFNVADHFDVTLGHSLGEFAAVVAGGYVSFQDSLYLVRKRAEAMSDATRRAIEEYGGEYGMVAVISHPEHMASLIGAIRDFVGVTSTGSKAESMDDVPPIEQVLIANINSKNQIVLSGNIERIKTLVTHLRQFLGYDPRAVRLKSDSPFHSPIMKPALSVMRDLLNQKSRVPGRENEDMVSFPGQLPLVSNVSARPICSKAEFKDLLARGCLDTVRWWDSIKYLDQEARIRRWVGVGPGKVGRNLVGKEVGMRGKDLVKGGGVWAITDPSEVEEVLRGLEDTAGIMEDDEYSE
ncbi:Adaptor complexes medium subunit family-domain-containing protein [Ilyonectria robusta]|uniref:Adaptor complexes medium subunit family-domain-containing protein n=1 Tax=Ilyonectria robusta TaxID=1079257 RepID=UPI001E8E2533|nr:Adaptor complexes medium subunit family-domain-containing protein [Ilyonectria robusta]KAH8699755.1 Adaptor complexes medium subunit family-domain-containing protein [Ilyonectria robusta]